MLTIVSEWQRYQLPCISPQRGWELYLENLRVSSAPCLINFKSQSHQAFQNLLKSILQGLVEIVVSFSHVPEAASPFRPDNDYLAPPAAARQLTIRDEPIPERLDVLRRLLRPVGQRRILLCSIRCQCPSYFGFMVPPQLPLLSRHCRN